MKNIPALEIINVSKTYKSGFQAVKNISLQIEPGDFYALLGPNGAGKSTTLGMISSLVNITSGEIKIFGHDVKTSPNQAKKYLGMMPQEVNLNIFETPEQILVNIAGYFGISRKRALHNCQKYLEMMDLLDKKNRD